MQEQTKVKCIVYLQAGWEGSCFYPRPYTDVVGALINSDGQLLHQQRIHTSPNLYLSNPYDYLDALVRDIASNCDPSIQSPIEVSSPPSREDIVGIISLEQSFFKSRLDYTLSQREGNHVKNGN